MIALLRAELGRALSRRLFLILLLLLVAAVLLAAIVTFFTSQKSDGRDAGTVFSRGQIRRCIETGAGLPPNTSAKERARFCRSQGTQFSTAPDKRFELASLPEIFLGTSTIVAMVAWLVGASFLGAEWHTGNITTTLTWEPRRLRLLAMKLIACLIVLAVAVLALHLLLGLALLPSAALRGSTSGVDWGETIAVVLRVTALAGIAGVLGFALAGIGRNTAAALGIGFAYLAIVETLVRAWKPAWSNWLIADNAVLFVSGEMTVFGVEQREPIEGAVVLLVYSLAAFAVAAVLFRTRDVT